MTTTSEVRKIQKVGYSTLTISIPVQYVKELDLAEGDSLAVRQEGDGTLRLIPVSRADKATKASIRADLVDEKVLSKLVVGCYMLGYDTIEIASKNGIRLSTTEEVTGTVKRLRGLEVVESSDHSILVQSFMDPTKFPVDLLIKRLEILVSRSFGNTAVAVTDKQVNEVLREVTRVQEEVDELYWLIVRQLLVAFKSKELSGKMGLESPLHTSGDRVSAKAMEEIGAIVLSLTKEIAALKKGGKVDARLLKKVEVLVKKAQEAFEVAVESLRSPDLRTIAKASEAIDETSQLQRELMMEALELVGPVETAGHVGQVASLVGRLAGHYHVITEIAMNRLLRKTSRICSIQEQ